MLPTLILSAGHDPFASGENAMDGTPEHELCTQLCFYLWSELQESGIPVIPVATGQLSSKIMFVNAVSTKLHAAKIPHFAVEIHLNSSVNPDARGAEVFHWKQKGQPRNLTYYMGSDILKSLCVLSWVSRGVKTQEDSNHSSLGWLTKTKPPALLVEVGFLTNKHDCGMLLTLAGRSALGMRLAEGISSAAYRMGEAGTSGGGVKSDEIRMMERKAWREGRVR